MTTSYILERQEDLKAHKKMMREAEKAAVEKMEEEKELRQAANEARIKAKVRGSQEGMRAPVKSCRFDSKHQKLAEVKVAERSPEAKG